MQQVQIKIADCKSFVVKISGKGYQQRQKRVTFLKVQTWVHWNWIHFMPGSCQWLGTSGENGKNLDFHTFQNIFASNHKKHV